MIEVTWYREKNLVVVKGHAGSDAYGKDLICAAASILTLTLLANLERMERLGLVAEKVTVLEEGYGEIGCRSADGSGQQVQEIFAVICEGFELLARQYPGFVSYCTAKL